MFFVDKKLGGEKIIGKGASEFRLFHKIRFGYEK